jgi:polyisoprenoid-binding protein YceI
LKRVLSKPLLAAVAAVVALLVVGSAGAYVYYFSGARSAPKALALATPTPVASPASTASGLAGKWAVAGGSQAEYRVKEQFAGQTSEHEAVARTSSVSGGFNVASDPAGYKVTGLQFSAQLTELHSVDSVAGFNVTQRDRIVQGALSTSQFPTASFAADSVTVPSTVGQGQPVTFSVPGKLTIHGVTRDATVQVTAQVSADKIDLAGTTSLLMTDFGITPPQVPITVVQPGVTINFSIVMTKV